MRTTAAEKEQLKEKILVRALSYLKEVGNNGAPVDKVMKKVGLTSGALYSHFGSKEDFFAQVVLRELDRLKETYTQRIGEEGKQGLIDFVEGYLSEEHVRGIGEGCVFVALGSDMQRSDAETRSQYESRIEELLHVLAEGLSSGTKAERLSRMRFIHSSMVGALMISRTMKTKEHIRATLEAARKNILALIR